MDTLEIETNSKPLIPINEYASRKGISLRTAKRYAMSCRIITETVKGEIMVVDLPTMPKRIEPPQEKQDRTLETMMGPTCEEGYNSTGWNRKKAPRP
jgi:hypothetical protein